MDEDMQMEEKITVKPKIQTTLDENKKIKLSKREIRERVRARMKKTVDERRKQKNTAHTKNTFEQMKNANTVDLSWFETSLNDLYSENPNIDVKIDDNINNYNRLTKLRVQFTHPLARFADGDLKQEYYNDNKPPPSIYDWTDLELIQLYKGMEQYGFDSINSWMKIAENKVPTRNFADIKVKLTQMLGIQSLSKYKGFKGNNVNELWISREFEKNKKEGISKNAWKNGQYMNGTIIDDSILNKENLNKKINEYNLKNKGFVEYRNDEFEDYDGSVYRFKWKDMINKSDLYGYNRQTFDLESSDDENEFSNDGNDTEYESMNDFNESDYEIVNDITVEKKEESV